MRYPTQMTPPLIHIQTGAQLRQYRKVLGLTLEQMATLLDVTWEAYRGWEVGKKDKQGLHLYLIPVLDLQEWRAKLQPENHLAETQKKVK